MVLDGSPRQAEPVSGFQFAGRLAHLRRGVLDVLRLVKSHQVKVDLLQ